MFKSVLNLEGISWDFEIGFQTFEVFKTSKVFVKTSKVV